MFVPYHRQKVEGKHIDINTPIMCTSCAIEALSPSTTSPSLNDIVGVLSRRDAQTYFESSHNNQHMIELYRDGLTIISDPSLSNAMNSLVECAIYPNALRKKGCTRELRNKKGSKNPQRRWAHIFPFDTSGSDSVNSSIKNQMAVIQTILGQILFPHEHYAITAKNGGEALMNGNREMRDRKAEVRRNTSSTLKLVDCNTLVKGPGVDTPQGMHVDGCALKLVVIYIDKCHKWYKFRFIKGSHRFLDQHLELHSTTRLPEKLFTEKNVKTGECIALFESTIHSGGVSSSNQPICGSQAEIDRKRYEKLGLSNFKWFGSGQNAGLLPVDLAIQLTFDLHSCPAPSTSPNQSNVWYDRSTELEFSGDECCIICDEELKSTEYFFGVCKHIIHKNCLLKTERCPICKKQWETDSSPVEFEKELNRLQENLSIECILKKSCSDFLDRQQTGQRIVPKRKLRDI